MKIYECTDFNNMKINNNSKNSLKKAIEVNY